MKLEPQDLCDLYNVISLLNCGITLGLETGGLNGLDVSVKVLSICFCV